MIDSFIDSLTIDKVQRHHNLQVCFLKSTLVSDMDIKTFDEMKDFVDVTEVNDGEVPFLSFLNRSPYKILVLSGSLISGNFQDRTVKTGFILHPYQNTKISVFCVEQGRWKDKISRGIKSKYHLSSDIRKNLRKSEQNDIWMKVKEKSERFKVNSPSGNIQDIYESRENQIEAFQKALQCNSDHIGIITVIHDKVTSIDVFAVKGIYPKLHASIMTSHIVDALDEQFCEEVRSRKPLTVDAFLKSIREAKREYISQDGNGQIISLESDRVVGDSLLDRDTLLELEAFPV